MRRDTVLKRDIGQELLEGIQAIKKGEGKQVTVQLPENHQMAIVKQAGKK